MNDFKRQHNAAKEIKENYPEGTRVYVDHISDGSYPEAVGNYGTVNYVDDMGQVFLNMENGTHATVCRHYGDVFFKVKEVS